MLKGRSKSSEVISAVRNVGGGFPPLDQRLQLTGRSWTPATIAQALRMGVEIPSYARAAAQFSELTHVHLSKSSLQDLVKAYGGRLVVRQAQEAQAMVAIPNAETEVVWREIAAPPSEVMNISMDGAMVNIRGEGWKEVKTVAVSAIRHLIDTVPGKVTTLLSDHSYRAGCGMRPNFVSSSGRKPVVGGWRRSAI